MDLSVCELLATMEPVLDVGRAKYWCERGEELYPHHPAIFQLKERLIKSEDDDPSKLETLVVCKCLDKLLSSICQKIDAEIIKSFFPQLRWLCDLWMRICESGCFVCTWMMAELKMPMQMVLKWRLVLHSGTSWHGK